jgi:hypothetical protein
MRWVGHVAHMRAIINAYGILVKKSEEERPLGRPRHRWEYENQLFVVMYFDTYSDAQSSEYTYSNGELHEW